MFWRASKESDTPKRRAVAGMSCIRPRAPFDETAHWSNSDSTAITARTRSALTWWSAAASSMWWSYSPSRPGARKPREWMSVPLPG